MKSFVDIRAVIFDVAGTLYVAPEFDDLVEEQAELALAKAKGWPIEEASSRLAAVRKENAATYGDKSKVRALQSLGVPREAFHGAVAALDPAPYLEGAPILRDLFSGLRAKELKIGLLSNFRRGLVDKILGPLGLTWKQIDVSICEDDGLPIKPSPVPFRAVCERLGVAAHEAVFVGDSLSKDLAPAKGLGMHTVLVESGARDGDIALADVVIREVRDFAPLVGAS
jgi:FMN phosphatase YigB (HAD superfamily)